MYFIYTNNLFYAILGKISTKDKIMNKAITNQFKKLGLGKLIDISTPKIVTTENNIQTVSQAMFEKNTSQTSDYISTINTETTNCFIVKNKSRYSIFQIKKTQKHETYVIDNGFSENNITDIEVILNGKRVAIKNDTDITDINSIRYQLRNNKRATRFIDTFILTDEKSRKKYVIYENKQQYLENKKQKSALDVKRQAKGYL